MRYYYNKDISDACGENTNIATLFDSIAYAIAVCKQNGKNTHEIEIEGKIEERTFMYNSVQGFFERYPKWSISKIRRYLKVLIANGFLIKAKYNYNTTAYNKTSWYCLKDESLLEDYLNNKSSVENPNNNLKSSDLNRQQSLSKKTNAVDTNNLSNEDKKQAEKVKSTLQDDRKDESFKTKTSSNTKNKTKLTTSNFKADLKNINSELVFENNAYSKMINFLEYNQIEPREYSSWLNDYVVNQKPEKFVNYYFSIFCKENNIESFQVFQNKKKP